MLIRKKYAAWASAVAITALTFLTPATSAGAAEARASVWPPDGSFHAWDGENSDGAHCAWYGDDTDWSSCAPAGNLRNRATSVENSGYTGAYEDVLVYWDTGYRGARACINNGSWYNLQYFRFPSNGAGGGEVMNNNISSHHWTNSCSENPVYIS
ncbi:peptidase inhibitor family I36 protein [Streptomyces collinus]|uniref:Peptidase inhibitor family I36 n=1 Tax=Streptomyces collinus TaxID=42684 RepID=A0AA89TZG5_STRCU|nr:peptidase inhibitor family I36 protein [Streptomyces collinus]MBB5816700.1 hypothetical protein [Streptomyces collinus]WMX62038.1 peptidase inhibitor family I36 protein [Streptomyces collinus]